jgi:hypothetical protein
MNDKEDEVCEINYKSPKNDKTHERWAEPSEDEWPRIGALTAQTPPHIQKNGFGTSKPEEYYYPRNVSSKKIVRTPGDGSDEYKDVIKYSLGVDVPSPITYKEEPKQVDWHAKHLEAQKEIVDEAVRWVSLVENLKSITAESLKRLDDKYQEALEAMITKLKDDNKAKEALIEELKQQLKKD